MRSAQTLFFSTLLVLCPMNSLSMYGPGRNLIEAEGRSPMARGRPLRELRLSPAEREQLVAVTRSRSMPHSLVNRARIILLAAEGWSNVVSRRSWDARCPRSGPGASAT